MAYDYLGLSTELGISPWLLVIIMIWSMAWKLAALWKSARKGSLIWFIVLALVNTVGILEILYIFLFSEMGKEMKPKKKKSKK
jgi:methionyl-tRNA synthetase